MIGDLNMKPERLYSQRFGHVTAIVATDKKAYDHADNVKAGGSYV